jgi:hypothetical protein
VREPSVDAGFRLGRIEDELGFPVFLQDSVVVIDDHGATGVAVQGDANVEHSEIHTKREYRCGGSSVEKKSLSTNENTDIFYSLVKTTTGHFYCGRDGDISNVV